ncbi:MAG: hypothetical protein COB49_02780 [Alphaproteobacteria bacterium]|nr:MAG: hypothetical protein COB49_02780 [Alphaproteobacteria bacterium]
MYRYITIVWNEDSQQVAETAKFLKGYFEGTEIPWEVAYDGRGLLVLHTGEEKNRMQAYPLCLNGDQTGGVVLGKLLNRESDLERVAKNADLNPIESQKIINSNGRHLVDEYWGSYVAFFQSGKQKYVQVDPIGIFSCFSTSYRDVEIYFTYLPDVASCKFLNFSVDWMGLAKTMINRSDQTSVPMNEITKILPGQCLTITPEITSKKFYWNPQKISQTDVIEDVEEAARTLRQCMLSTVASLAEPYNNIINQIGGLDSSIILASLGEISTPLEIACLNLYEDSPCGDERYFARQAADHVGVPLIEYKKEMQKLSFDDISMVPITTSPTDYSFRPRYVNFLSRTLKERGAQAMFNGTGGDEILYGYGKDYAPIDYIKSHGIRPPLFSIIMEASRMQNRSIWSILPGIIQGGFGKNRFDVDSTLRTSLLAESVEDEINKKEIAHPWLEFRDNVTPGKIDHISPLTSGLYNRENAVSPEGYFTTIYPYLSQPVIETCLRIPLWLMMANGQNRGLARKAFKNYLPPEVIWRGTKSVGSNFLWSFTLENLDVIQDLLMDGELVKAGFINRRNLEKVLKREHNIEKRDFAFLHFYLIAEIWARKMKGETFTEFTQSEVA